MSTNRSALETLPDEILLEICKYLLCNDILLAFVGLNNRMTQMITQYRRCVSFHKTSITNFHYLCVKVLPQIGHQIRSLLIDCCYSVLQDVLFLEYFGEKMSMIFPQLERVSLMAYQYDQLVAFLGTLHDLDHLEEVRLYSLFPIDQSQQSAGVRSLFQANNQRLTSIHMDNKSSSFSFKDLECYENILRLSIKLTRITDLPFLFSAVPNVHYLDVIIEEPSFFFYSDRIYYSSLLHLTSLRLHCVEYMWVLEKLLEVLRQLPSLQQLTLFLSTRDARLVNGNTIIESLPCTLQQFNYAIVFSHRNLIDKYETIVASWPSSHPVMCYYDDKDFLFIHTLPWNFDRMNIPYLKDKKLSSLGNTETGYDKQVKQIDATIDRELSFAKLVTIVSQFCRVKQITIELSSDHDTVKDEKPPVLHCAKLPRLNHILIYGEIPSDLTHFSFILTAATNLFRLDLPITYLLKLFEDQQICRLLDQRITALGIYQSSSGEIPMALDNEHISIIGSRFSRLRDLCVDFTDLPCNTETVTTEGISDESDQQEHAAILSGSSEPMLLCLLNTFKEHKLIGLCAEGQFGEEIKTNAEQWLRKHSILSKQLFKATFNNDINQLLIWM